VKSNVCHGVKPVNDRRVEDVKIRDIETGQKILFDIANTTFHTSFFISFSNGTGRNGEAVVIGKIQVFGIEGGLFADNAFEYG